MYDYSQDIYIELQDINNNLQSFIQQENYNNDLIISSIDSNNYKTNVFIGCCCLILIVFNLLNILPKVKRPLRKEK